MSIVLKENEVGYFPSYILQRIRKNKNFIAAVTGETGSGKTYSCIRLGELLDPEFTVDNIVFTCNQFMDLINGTTKQLDKGAVIVWDEMQVAMSHLDFRSVQAMVINYLLQTFRHRNLILLIATPNFSFLNASTRKLVHSRMETVGIDENEKICSLKPFLIQINQKSGKIYEKYLRARDTRHGIFPVEYLDLDLASKELIKAYEEKKDNFTVDLNKDIAETLRKLTEKEPPKSLTQKQEDILDYLKEGLTIPEISDKKNISIQTIYRHIGLIEKKGYSIEPIKEKQTVLGYKVGGFA